MRRTKMICTLGPSSTDVEIIKKLLKSGMDAARINFSHGNYESHQKTIDNFKIARKELNLPIPLILDTKGPEIRVGLFENDKIILKEGDLFTLTPEEILGTKEKTSITYKDLWKDISVNTRIVLNDGLIELKVVSIEEKDIITEVINGGELTNNKSVNVPNISIKLPYITKKDEEDIIFGIKNGFDYIAASFIRNVDDINKLKDLLKKYKGEHIKIIVKIENREGLDNIDEILEAADGLMVARGDLGVEIATEEVPIVQKMLIKKSNQAGKFVIIATQMLESMITSPIPTRAEASDIANAIFDGADAIMLSGETAMGLHPCEAVSIMAKITEKTESSIDYKKRISNYLKEKKSIITDAISYGTCTITADIDAVAIITVTNSGITARRVSKFRPNVPIIAVTCNEIVYRQLNLIWGCMPIISESITDKRYVFPYAVKKAEESKTIKNGDYVVIVAGVPLGVTGSTNTIKVAIVGDDI